MSPGLSDSRHGAYTSTSVGRTRQKGDSVALEATHLMRQAVQSAIDHDDVHLATVMLLHGRWIELPVRAILGHEHFPPTVLAVMQVSGPVDGQLEVLVSVKVSHWCTAMCQHPRGSCQLHMDTAITPTVYNHSPPVQCLVPTVGR
jgi:hypothetical protein